MRVQENFTNIIVTIVAKITVIKEKTMKPEKPNMLVFATNVLMTSTIAEKKIIKKYCLRLTHANDIKKYYKDKYGCEYGNSVKGVE